MSTVNRPKTNTQLDDNREGCIFILIVRSKYKITEKDINELNGLVTAWNKSGIGGPGFKPVKPNQ